MSNNGKTPVRRGALGKGLNSLLGGVDTSERETNVSAVGSNAKNLSKINQSMILNINPNSVDPNPQQPRRFFVEQDLIDLSNSIKEDGIIQPIVVSKGEQAGRYTLIAGERRLRASKMAGLTEIPVIIKEVANDDLLRLAIIENIQRADLNIIEEAHGYLSLIKDYGLTQEQCAKKVGKERSTITNALRIIKLPREVQDDIVEKRLSMGHARALLSLEDKKELLKARDIVLKKQLSVRQTEQLCKRIKTETNQIPSNENKVDPNLNYIAEKLRSNLRTKVKVSGSGSRGRIEISYFSTNELERILGIISN